MLPAAGLDNYNQNVYLREPCLVNVMDAGESILSSSSSRSEKKSTDPCKSHKEAERRRRQRINAHLSTLRTLLPSTTKTDKASLLAEVVHHVKELRKQATSQVARGGGETELPDQQYWPFPGESDEASLSYCDGPESKTMRVSVCCDDRPGLNQELADAIRSVHARAVRAEMMTVGGRTKSVVVVQWGTGGGGRGGEEDVGVLRRAIKSVVENRGAGSSGPGLLAHGNKRVRDYGDEFGIKKNERVI
ncbi:transcription factor bHLH30 [Ricinus communis]|uniref:DNA binding protein, putative n=1 Tax=Ricinus communis TaxID=3988 RepID=B9RJW6_RICCO|nr:transcription factor bHLH30 [Ricinus communis]EEF48618.1 DNA binding protein, putative [Ricinus communis]|eukprot:XP_002514035.1 transcription factor bHLH30 [Ricinus communis]